MRSIMQLLAGLLVGLGTAACSQTIITDLWKNPDVDVSDKNYSKIAAVGITKGDGGRRIFEDELVAKLRNRGIEAEPTYPVAPVSSLTLKNLRPKLEKLEADAILTSRVVAVDKEVTYLPANPYHAPYYSWYDDYYYHSVGHAFYGYEDFFSPERVVSVQVRMETNLYDAKTGKLVCSAQSQTTDPDSISELAASLSPSLVEQLLKCGVTREHS